MRVPSLTTGFRALPVVQRPLVRGDWQRRRRSHVVSTIHGPGDEFDLDLIRRAGTGNDRDEARVRPFAGPEIADIPSDFQ